MTIAYLSSASAETNTIALPTHQRGDLLFIFATNTDNTQTVIMPEGWFYGGHQVGLDNDNLTMAFKPAMESGTPSGTWDKCNFIVAAVYRPIVNWHFCGLRNFRRSPASPGSNAPRYERNYFVNGFVTGPFAGDMQAHQSVCMAFGFSRSKAVSLNLPPTGTSTKAVHVGSTIHQFVLFDTGAPVTERVVSELILSAATTWLTGSVPIVDTGIPIESVGGGGSGSVLHPLQNSLHPLG